jgi:ATP-binding cassette subfamily B multidrug efflux pump
MRRLVRYLAPYKTQVGIALVFMIANAGLQIAGPLLTKIAIDTYLAPTGVNEYSRFLPPDPWQGLTRISIVYLAVILLTLVCDFFQAYLMQRTGQYAMFDLRRDLMAHMQRVDIAYYDRNPLGRLVTRVTTDVDVLNELFSSGLITIAGDVLVLSFIVTVMFRLSAGMTMMLIGATPLVVWATIIFRNSVQQSYRRIRIAVAKINAYLQEHVTGIAVLQLYNRERKSASEFDAINRDHMVAFKESIFAYGWFYPTVEFLGMATIALLLAYGGYRVRAGTVTLGVMVAFFQYGMRFFRPIQDLSEKYNIIQGAMAAGERVFKLLDTEVDINAPSAPKLPPAAGAIEFKNVWFAYKDQDWVLKDVSFRIAPGETIAVVGHTGAGKTTLTNLLLRFYDIQKGSIEIGGIDIREFAPASLRRMFSIVLQDPFLFTGTLAANIRLGTQGIGDAQLRSAAEQVNLLDFVDSLPGGFDYEVRERGAGLSTGQKQLINFARALAHDPQYLILDEATSSVDTETEFKVRSALEHMVQDRTSIVIAHRLSTIQRANRILVMHKGRVREAGTHQELLALRGIYWKLYQLQYKDQEVA